MKKFRFFFHYNKPYSKIKGEHYWSVHFKRKCYLVKNINCKVETISKVNKTQLYVVMQGFANNVIIDKENIEIL